MLYSYTGLIRNNLCTNNILKSKNSKSTPENFPTRNIVHIEYRELTMAIKFTNIKMSLQFHWMTILINETDRK